MAIAFAAAFGHATTGIGYAMLAMSLMAFYMTGVESAAVVCCCCLVLVLYMTWKLRRHINYRIMCPPMIGLLIGKTGGVALLMYIDPGALRIALGLTFVFIVFHKMNRRRIEKLLYGYMAVMGIVIALT